MTNVLNLALKKEIFEGLVNRTNNEIPIEKSSWWRKRLMDIDTGVFKDFDVVKASCGSADKLDFPIKKIVEKEDNFIVIIDFVDVDTDDSDFDENVPNTLEDIQKVINEKFTETVKSEYVTPTITVTESKENEFVSEIHTKARYAVCKEDGLKKRIVNFIDDFCKNNRVFAVSGPSVYIRKNGQIVGTNKCIKSNKDFDTIIPLHQERIIKYKNVSDDEFYDVISKKFNLLLTNNYFFIDKGSCQFTKLSTDEDVFTFRFATKRKYLFNQ